MVWSITGASRCRCGSAKLVSKWTYGGSGPNFWVSSAGTAGVMTSVGGPIFQVHQYGSLYGSTANAAALMLQTDNPNGLNNYLLAGNLAGSITFSLRADGQAYFLGNVGIGTTSPGYTLDVAGQIHSGSGGFVFPDGSTQASAFSTTLCGGDYAESVDVNGVRIAYEPGDVLVIDPASPGKFLKANQPYSTLVAGVYSTKPGITGRRQSGVKNPDEVPMAMIGIVPVKASAENGSIQLGDLLVTSSTPGFVMRGTDRSQLLGAVVGKAMQTLPSGRGTIEVLVTLQ